MAGSPSLCLSTLCSVGEVHSEDTGGEEYGGADSPSLAGPNMVSSSPGTVGRGSSSTPQDLELLSNSR